MKAIKNLYNQIWSDKVQKEEGEVCSRVQEALKLIDTGGKLLDIGCGDGVLLSSVGRCESLFGVDISSPALKIAVSRGLKVLKIDFNTGNIPFKDHIFNTIVCLDVIEHIFEPDELIREAKRLLKKGGIFIVSTPNIRFIEHLSMLLTEGCFPKTSYDAYSYDGGHIHYFTFSDIRILLERNGFKILEEGGVAYRPFRSVKMSIFRIIARVWENQVEKEFFHRGIIVKAQRING